MTSEYIEYADEASKKLAADIEPIVAGYHAKVEKLVAARDAALVESERIKREALETFNAARDEEGKTCAETIRAAAQKRAKESERPEWILEACESYVKPIESNGGTLEPSSIVKQVGMHEKARIDGEAAAQTKQRRMGIMRGVYDMPGIGRNGGL